MRSAPSLRPLWHSLLSPALLLGLANPSPAAVPANLAPFVEKNCTGCHDAAEKKGGLDLESAAFDPKDPKNFALWETVFDRVQDGQMPPKKKARPEQASLDAFLRNLAAPLVSADQARLAPEGRSTWRRLNRYEYENSVRDLLGAPWLQIRDALPEDGEAFRFNKVGEALDVSHVQVARYLGAADYALRQALAPKEKRPETKVTRYYTRDEGSYTGKMKFNEFNQAPERATFPTLGFAGQPDVRAAKAPMTVGKANKEQRELEGVGVVASSYEPIEPKFSNFKAPVAGRYKLRLMGQTVWVGPGPDKKWFIPDLDNISKGRRSEPITVYSDTTPRQLRRQGTFDLTPEPAVHELDVWLLAGETIRVDAGRLFRSRPGAGRWQNPLAEKDGQPGVVFRWLEVEGPFFEQWPPAGHQLMFGDLPFKKSDTPGTPVEVVSTKPKEDATRLLKGFLQTAYRHPGAESEMSRFLPVIENALKTGSSFTDSMIAGYTAVLCSPAFVCVEEKPGKLDQHALAARLSYFLWNSAPDKELRDLATKGTLSKPDVLKAQTERLLNDPKAGRFTEAFLAYWLDLRKIQATSPDSTLYPDYYLDDLLAESAEEETVAFFNELIHSNLPTRNLVSSDFVMVNERLATHYGLPGFEGVQIRKVKLPADSPRGGLITQASVLKVTANGTTTSPVLRGGWVLERIMGKPVPRPPPNIPAVEPDIRGTVTLRQQLDKHRDQTSCASCHSRMDPPGFALENFDVMGAWRDTYRAAGAGKPPVPGIAKSGQKFEFSLGLPVDATGELADGRKFGNIRDFKTLLLTDEKQLARNLVRQFAVYATGAPVRFGDRPAVEKILQASASKNYGVRTLIHSLVQSELFQSK